MVHRNKNYSLSEIGGIGGYERLDNHNVNSALHSGAEMKEVMVFWIIFLNTAELEMLLSRCVMTLYNQWEERSTELNSPINRGKKCSRILVGWLSYAVISTPPNIIYNSGKPRNNNTIRLTIHHFKKCSASSTVCTTQQQRKCNKVTPIDHNTGGNIKTSKGPLTCSILYT